jgi:hypothetical protein
MVYIYEQKMSTSLQGNSMLLSDPDSSIYQIDGSRMNLAKEYRDNLRGPFSLELQRILDRMRTTPLKGRFVLLILEPFREFGLARLSGERGVAPSPVDNVKYNSIADAEWDIFKRRWQELTGISITIKDPK